MVGRKRETTGEQVVHLDSNRMFSLSFRRPDMGPTGKKSRSSDTRFSSYVDGSPPESRVYHVTGALGGFAGQPEGRSQPGCKALTPIWEERPWG
jgi:hypothetical protein